ncbi:glycosyltransferase [Rossellomorea vietnamensis]|nr:glycosyltransferase [Rossellomorea vietnamensis]
MKKIGILVPSLSDGGAEMVAANLSVLYEELGYKPYIILYENRVTFKYAGKIIDLNIKRRKGLLGKVLKDIEIYRKLKKVKQTHKFDLVISHLPKSDLINVLTKGNEKIITTIHNNIEVDYPMYMKVMLKLIVKKSDLVVSVSKVGEEYLKAKFNQYKDKIKTIYNFHDIKKIQKKGKENLDPDEKDIFKYDVIINIGRLGYQKGQWHLIKAFSHLLKKKNDVKLVIIGQGELEKKLKEMSKDLGIDNQVCFLGFKDNPYKYLANANLYVSTSLHEGLPMTLIEAMSFKLPVISTDCVSGPREIIAPDKRLSQKLNYSENYKYGLLVPDFGNKSSLQSHLMLSEEEKALGDKLYEILMTDNLIDKYNKVSEVRSKDFDKENISKLWNAELNKIMMKENSI